MTSFFLQLITTAYAQTAPNANDIINSLPRSRFNNIGDVVVGVINWLLMLGGILAVIALVYSGIMYITAGGDTAKADAAKKNITWAIIGIVIILLSLVIVSWVSGIVSGAMTP